MNFIVGYNLLMSSIHDFNFSTLCSQKKKKNAINILSPNERFTLDNALKVSFGLNTERHGVFSEYYTEYFLNAGKYGPEKL